ncbi:MAG: holo-ACP synthase [Rhodospirillales bacterium]
MVVLGTGIDLLDIRRIERTIDRFGDRFRERVYTPLERLHCSRRAKPAAAYAMRYAGKEACAKALGTGFRAGIFWRDIEIDSLPSGKPILRLTGGALTRLLRLTPPSMIAGIDISLSDEYPYAQAFVVISAHPSPAPGVADGAP